MTNILMYSYRSDPLEYNNYLGRSLAGGETGFYSKENVQDQYFTKDEESIRATEGDMPANMSSFPVSPPPTLNSTGKVRPNKPTITYGMLECL